MSVTSGFNAIAHAVEALYAPDASPIISLMAEEGVRALVTALPNIVADPGNIEPRTDALYGAWLCGATPRRHHHVPAPQAVPHPGRHLQPPPRRNPHRRAPYALAYNAPSAPAAVEALRRATGAEDPAAHLRELSLKLGAPASLRELGLTEENVETAVDLATRNPYANPREITPEGIRRLLTAALNGGPVTA